MSDELLELRRALMERKRALEREARERESLERQTPIGQTLTEETIVLKSTQETDKSAQEIDKRKLCHYCHSQSKYTCPTCYVRSCSLECIKKHKPYCTVKKPKYKPMSQITKDDLSEDFKWLNHIHENVKPLERQKKRKPGLLKAASQLGIRLHLMPIGFTKQQQNKSRILKNEIEFTCEIRAVTETKWIQVKTSERLPLEGFVYLDTPGGRQMIDPTRTLGELLMNQTIVEFPTFYQF
ncbi:hypothetical protein EDD86DRAFT_199974 [Gorgonomyces haynaldii]|nr:hypothetical protein EDD86DRAFT_199974 [Gorgonomyces haynaldii]